MKRTGIDVVRIVWAEEYEPLHVEPSADCPGYVRVATKSTDAEQFWGVVGLTMPADFARQLAKAILACADEQDAEATK